MTMTSQGFHLAAWSLMLSQRQDFSNNHLARVSITANQEGNMEMSDEMLSSGVAKDLDTNGYQVSDLANVQFYLEIYQLDVDVFFTPGINTPFPFQLLTILRWVQWLKTPF